MVAYSIGLDFGTEEARAMLLDMKGNVLASSSFTYPHGVMDRTLPDGSPLESNFALQHPQDYMEALDRIIPAVLEGIDPRRVIGIGVDFTQCTMMPVDAAGRPLCLLEGFEGNPYAYVKLWKHHGGQPQAEKLTAVARERQEPFLDQCGGIVYAESMFPKILETLEKAPEVYEAAGAFIELADWTTFYLTGSRRRSRSIASAAALWHGERGYPDEAYFEAVNPAFAGVVKDKLSQDLVVVGDPVGYVSREMAERLGLVEGTPVAAGLGDSHAAFVGAGLAEQNVLLTVMGTSSCDMLVSEKEIPIPGLYGISYDSILPGQFGYEAGQATMGDLFQWFAETCVPESYLEEAKRRELPLFDYFNELAKKQLPGENGLLALDWWNGNRSVLLDADLTGLMLGMRTNTRPEDLYRAFTEALTFGKRRIVEQFEDWGIPIRELYATGGVAMKNPFLMQMFADALGIPVHLSASDNGSCVGSAIYGASAAGPEHSGYASLTDIVHGMGVTVSRSFQPDAGLKPRYDKLYEEYKILYDYFGTDNLVMKRLQDLRRQ